MGNMTIYVDHIEIEKGIKKVRAFMDTNDVNKSNIMSELEGLEGTIRIDGKKPSNKKEDFAIAAKSFNTNNENTINTLNHIVDSYFVAKGNSVTLINNEKDKL